MHSPPSTKQRLDSLTGLRFVAALMVFAFHSLRYGTDHVGDTLLLAGPAGVSFFFMLSGFVMAWTARSGDTPWSFYRRRFARVYPAYVVAWVASLGVMLAQGRTPSLVDLVPLTLLQAWVPDEAVYWATNAVFWSLSCEAFFYLVFPVVHRLLSRLTVRALVWSAGGLVVVVWTYTVLVAATAPVGLRHWLLGVLPLARLPEFVLGAVMGLLAVRGLRSRFPVGLAGLLAAAAFLAAGQAADPYREAAITLVPFALLTWSAAQADLAGRGGWLGARPLVHLGAWSYAFYLVHTQAMTTWFELTQRLGFWDKDTVAGTALAGALLGALAVGLVGAYVLHRVVEVPAERRLRPGGQPAPVTTSS